MENLDGLGFKRGMECGPANLLLRIMGTPVGPFRIHVKFMVFNFCENSTLSLLIGPIKTGTNVL